MSACASLKDSSYRYKELDITHGTNWYQRSAAGRFVSENFSISSTAFYTRRAVNVNFLTVHILLFTTSIVVLLLLLTKRTVFSGQRLHALY